MSCGVCRELCSVLCVICLKLAEEAVVRIYTMYSIHLYQPVIIWTVVQNLTNQRVADTI